MSAVPIQDHFVHVCAEGAALAEVIAEQKALERFSCNASSLMTLGQKLFDLAFPRYDDVVSLATQLASAVRGDHVLRLWLRTDEKAALLPWEYLCLTESAAGVCRNVKKLQTATRTADEPTFLALHPNVSLIRQSGDVAAGGDLNRIGKLRVLLVWAQPDDELWGPIAGLQAEVASIKQALHQLPDSHVQVEAVDHATPQLLRQFIGAVRPHVLHYAGHGAFPQEGDPEGAATQPALVLENGAGGHAYFGGAELRSLCAEASVQVVVLNSCWGAKASGQFAGLAQALTTVSGEGRAVPVVVAHQMEVPQAAASGFARPFYQNLVIGLPVEEGVRAFRRECVAASPRGVGAPDWGIPVVHLGTRSTNLFRYERVDLYPLDFGQLIREHVPIVGRKFVRDEVDRFLNERPSGVFLLTAPPGIGKTAFLAQLVEDDPTRTYFFYRAAAGLTDPDDWVKSTYQGLLGRYGIREENPTNDRAELRTRLKQWLLPKVSQACAESGRRELILLDALDESGSTITDHKNALEVLPEKLPPHVHLLITSRPGPLAEACALRADAFGAYSLDPASAGNREDAAGFCVRELRRVSEADEPTLTRLGALLAERAEGNFLVLKLFFGRDALKGRTAPAQIEREAADLTGDVRKEYERFFKRATEDVSNDREGMKMLSRVLGAFVTARAPVTAEQVCEAFGVDFEDWEWSLRRVRQFLAFGGVRQEERGAVTYRIYHETFREFLKDRLKSRMGEFNLKWADHSEQWRKRTGYARLYALRHLVSHLIAAAKG